MGYNISVYIFLFHLYMYIVLIYNANLFEIVYDPNSWRYPLTSIVFPPILWKSMGTVNCLISQILQNICFQCSAEDRKSYRLGTTWGLLNDSVFIFVCTIPLIKRILCIIDQLPKDI